MKNLKSKLLTPEICSILSLVAVFCVTLSANTTCMFLAHQEEQPEGVKKFRKF